MRRADARGREVAVSLKGITKVFGRITANKDVTLDIYKGEILSLLGENGSGKTTLMNMLSGIYYPDSGSIEVNGVPVTIRSPKDAFDLHIGMIHQHFKLVDLLTAAENVILGLKQKKAVLDMNSVRKRVLEISERYGFNIDPDKKVYDMSVSEKQTLEIVKVLYRGADILILDEPTAVLTPQETQKLFGVMRNMKKDGKSIVIITHKLHEVMEISDRVAVLRKGRFVGDIDTVDTNPQELTDMMVGHRVSLNIDRPEPVNVKECLRVEHLSVIDQEGVKKLDDVSFVANAGEILGIAGVSGSGQKELLEVVAGLQQAQPGSLVLYTDKAGKTSTLIGKTPMEIKKLGVNLAFVPEDRLGMGLVGDLDIADNMLIRTYTEGGGMFVNMKKPRKLAEEIVEEFEVVTPDLFTPVRKLSGGNVQKVLVGREISGDPSLLMSAYAVRGLDINTSYTIYRLMNEQKCRGTAIIYVGEDLDVLLELCDRILVLCSGRVSGIVDGRTTTKEEVGLLMTHLGKAGEDE
ncbi:MAG: ABC transporter ATP-binding protein [Clostridia bacterium]|nr:ABC transporter ATP-binding protein [Clostridia bacterium]